LKSLLAEGRRRKPSGIPREPDQAAGALEIGIIAFGEDPSARCGVVGAPGSGTLASVLFTRVRVGSIIVFGRGVEGVVAVDRFVRLPPHHHAQIRHVGEPPEACPCCHARRRGGGGGAR
jgi:hypothetical protein